MTTSYCLHKMDSQLIFVKPPFCANLLSTMCQTGGSKLGKLFGFYGTFSTNIIILQEPLGKCPNPDSPNLPGEHRYLEPWGRGSWWSCQSPCPVTWEADTNSYKITLLPDATSFIALGPLCLKKDKFLYSSTSQGSIKPSCNYYTHFVHIHPPLFITMCVYLHSRLHRDFRVKETA